MKSFIFKLYQKVVISSLSTQYFIPTTFRKFSHFSIHLSFDRHWSLSDDKLLDGVVEREHLVTQRYLARAIACVNISSCSRSCQKNVVKSIESYLGFYVQLSFLLLFYYIYIGWWICFIWRTEILLLTLKNNICNKTIMYISYIVLCYICSMTPKKDVLILEIEQFPLKLRCFEYLFCIRRRKWFSVYS